MEILKANTTRLLMVRFIQRKTNINKYILKRNETEFAEKLS